MHRIRDFFSLLISFFLDSLVTLQKLWLFHARSKLLYFIAERPQIFQRNLSYTTRHQLWSVLWLKVKNTCSSPYINPFCQAAASLQNLPVHMYSPVPSDHWLGERGLPAFLFCILSIVYSYYLWKVWIQLEVLSHNRGRILYLFMDYEYNITVNYAEIYT